MDRRVQIGIALVLVLIVVCCVCTACGGLAVVGGWLYTMATEPFEAVVSASAPSLVEKGESFVIEVTVENPTDEALLLDSIDIAESYLDGIHVERSEPPFGESYHLPIFDQQVHVFQKIIPAREELVVKLFAVALKTGDFAGVLDVCMDPGGCQSHRARTVVEE